MQMPNMPIGTVNNGLILTKTGWIEYVKKSGAKQGMTKHKKLYISAWNASKTKGLIKISAFENRLSKTYERELKTGDVKPEICLSMMFEVFYSTTGNTVLELGFYNLTTGVVVLGKVGLTIATKAANGGYCGTYKKA
jgi:hypothetical protein